MKKTILILAVVLLVGCDNRNEIARYKCNKEQWEQVVIQTDYCIENDMLHPSICLGAVKSTLCDFVHPLKTKRALTHE